MLAQRQAIAMVLALEGHTVVVAGNRLGRDLDKQQHRHSALHRRKASQWQPRQDLTSNRSTVCYNHSHVNAAEHIISYWHYFHSLDMIRQRPHKLKLLTWPRYVTSRTPGLELICLRPCLLLDAKRTSTGLITFPWDFEWGQFVVGMQRCQFNVILR